MVNITFTRGIKHIVKAQTANFVINNMSIKNVSLNGLS
jgi:hypothetical protein